MEKPHKSGESLNRNIKISNTRHNFHKNGCWQFKWKGINICSYRISRRGIFWELIFFLFLFLHLFICFVRGIDGL